MSSLKAYYLENKFFAKTSSRFHDIGVVATSKKEALAEVNKDEYNISKVKVVDFTVECIEKRVFRTISFIDGKNTDVVAYDLTATVKWSFRNERTLMPLTLLIADTEKVQQELEKIYDEMLGEVLK